MTAAVRTTTATVHSAVHRTDCHGPVNLCLSKQHGRPRQREENRIYLYAALNLKRNNRRLRSTYCTIEANYWQTRSISRGLSATSRLLFKQLRLSVVVKINGIVTTTQREQIQWADPTWAIASSAFPCSSYCCNCWNWCWNHIFVCHFIEMTSLVTGSSRCSQIFKLLPKKPATKLNV